MAKTVLHQILDRSDFSPTTKANYQLAIDRWIEFAGADPSRWTRERAQDYYDHLLTTGIKVKSANVYLANLRYVSRWYAKRNSDDRLDFAIVQSRTGEDEVTRHALDHDQGIALVKACDGTDLIDIRDLALIVVGLETGMRRMSLCAMEWDKVHATRALPTVLVPIKGPGGKATFEVPLSDTALVALERWRKASGGKGHVFQSLVRCIDFKAGRSYAPSGEGLHENGLAKIIRTRATSAGIDGVHPHILRHTFITWRTTAGLTPQQIASITGHKGFGFQGMKSYVDMAQLAQDARNATPTWLKNHVDNLVRAS